VGHTKVFVKSEPKIIENPYCTPLLLPSFPFPLSSLFFSFPSLSFSLSLPLPFIIVSPFRPLPFFLFSSLPLEVGPLQI